MKKLAALSSTGVFLLNTSVIFAQDISIGTPQVNGQTVGFANIGSFITNALAIAFIIALLLVLVMLIWGAFEWITSGGDKEAVGKARGKIINALIGLAVLAVAFALFRVGANFIGIDDPTKINIPRPPR